MSKLDIPSLIHKLANLLGLSELDETRLVSLISPHSHTPYFTRYRRNIVNKRIQIISALFAILNLAWIGVDWFFLPTEISSSLITYRLISSAIFLFLALRRAEENESYGWRLGLLFLNPLVFYMLSLGFLYGVKLEGFAGVLVEIYILLPFVIISGITVFPLTMVESGSLGLFGLVSLLLGSWWVTGAGELAFMPLGWILLLMLGVTILATATQLHFMQSLLHRISYDPLTAVYSRSTGREMIDLYFHLALDQNAPFTLAFVDLDHFKSINDNFGHEEGDEALRKAAASLKQHFRRSDIVIRWGGEEFLIILPGTDAGGAKLVFKRMMADWLGTRPEGKPLTASIGIAERVADGIKDWPQLLELADQRMYKAKQGGRARAVSIGEEPIVSG